MATTNSKSISYVSPVHEFLQTEIYFDQTINEEDNGLILPNVEDFAPSLSDADVLANLTAIYRSHSTSLIECIRFMKLKQFFHLISTFQGSLTAPVHKLFTDPCMSRWVYQSDWETYKVQLLLLFLIFFVVCSLTNFRVRSTF